MTRLCIELMESIEPVEQEEYEIIGWISRGMNVYKTEAYKEMFDKGKQRKPPRIYVSEKVAARYGNPVPVYTKKEQ